MGRKCVLGALLMIGLIGISTGGLAGTSGLNLSSETILAAMERNTQKGSERTVIPVYEFLGLDYQDTERGRCSLHLLGWGRTDLADSAFFEDNPDGDLVYGYIDLHPMHWPLQARLGRQEIFAGITRENVDGLLLEQEIVDQFSVTLYGGLPTDFNESNGYSGDLTYGGRLSHQLMPSYQFGLSYQYIEDNGQTVESNTGIDLNIHSGGWFSLDGLSGYNLETQGWREHRYSVQIMAAHVQVEPVFHQFQYADYFGTDDVEALPYQFLNGTDETLISYGTDFIYNPIPEFQFGLRSRQYDYKLRSENASYAAGLLVFSTPAGSQIGLEAGRMEGQSRENMYDLFQAYIYWHNPLQLDLLESFSADALIIYYDKPIYNEDSSIQVSLGAGRQFYQPHLETKFSLLYRRDPYFEDDISGLITLRFNY